MSYSSKNYSTDGGDKLVIGGALEIAEGATVTGLVTAATEYTDTKARDAIKTKAEVDALESPAEDYADLTEATAAIKAVIDALKA
ncbi:hypothetical protein ACUSIJ_24950 [Pseudochelatococcus sp. B33]